MNKDDMKEGLEKLLGRLNCGFFFPHISPLMKNHHKTTRKIYLIAKLIANSLCDSIIIKKGGISLCGAISCRHENSSSIILYLDMVDKTGAALTFFLTLTKNRRSSLLFLAHLVLDLHGRKKNKIRTPYIYSLLKI